MLLTLACLICAPNAFTSDGGFQLRHTSDSRRASRKFLNMLKESFEPIRAWSAHRPTVTYINIHRGVHKAYKARK